MIKLLYIYIHDTGNILQQGFNLSSDFFIDLKFEYKKESKRFVNPKLTLNHSNQQLPHIFHNDILDVKGIVGENGAGKSTLLRYLAFKGHENDISLVDKVNSYDLLVYLEIDDFDSGIYIQAGKKWNLEYRDIINHTGFTLQPNFLTENDHHVSWRDIPHFSKTNFIFYSNVFDNKPEIAFNDLLNISTNCLIRSDATSWTNNRIRVSDVEAHRIMEGRRQLEFSFPYKDKLPFKTPDGYLIYFNGHSQILIQNKIVSITNQGDADNELLKLLKLWIWLVERYSKISPERLLQRLVHKAYFNNLVLNYIVDENHITEGFFKGYREYVLKVFRDIIRLYIAGRGVVKLSNLIKKASLLENSVKANTEIYSLKVTADLGDSALSNNISAFKLFDEHLASTYKTSPQIVQNGFLIKINQQTISLYTSYIKSVYLTHYLDFSFPGLSSGELGYLTLFSRFFALVSGARSLNQEVEDHIDNLVILIDEGDLYFHPRWQSQYLKFLNEVLPKIFPIKKIQIILTSHSQFLASDLPVENLLFLKRESDEDKTSPDGKPTYGCCKVVSGPSYTFAANLHDLLADTFFLQGAQIGEFAKDIVFQIVAKLAGEKSDIHWTDEQIVKMIDQIGEPFIKNKLLEKFQIYRQNQN